MEYLCHSTGTPPKPWSQPDEQATGSQPPREVTAHLTRSQVKAD